MGAIATSTGFAEDKVIQTFVPNGAWKTKAAPSNSRQGELGSRGSWFIFAANK